MKHPNHSPRRNLSHTNKTSHRRFFLKACAGAATAIVCPSVFAAKEQSMERKLSFYNTHTAEKMTATYWAEGQYIEDSLIDINNIMRDHRTGEVYPIDHQLLDLLHNLQTKVEKKDPFSIISCYRSPATNAMLNNKSNGVAKRSLHMQGKAIDIRLPGCDLNNLRKAALAMKRGGVGYYPESDFIHVDTGRTRFW